LRDAPFDPAPYRAELEALKAQFGRKLNVLNHRTLHRPAAGRIIPHKPYLQMLQAFCRENDLVFILDEVQSELRRTGDLFAFETYGLEPDLVVLGKGVGPTAVPWRRRSVCRRCSMPSITAKGSDTWSANPLCCAACLGDA